MPSEWWKKDYDLDTYTEPISGIQLNTGSVLLYLVAPNDNLFLKIKVLEDAKPGLRRLDIFGLLYGRGLLNPVSLLDFYNPFPTVIRSSKTYSRSYMPPDLETFYFTGKPLKGISRVTQIVLPVDVLKPLTITEKFKEFWDVWGSPISLIGGGFAAGFSALIIDRLKRSKKQNVKL